MNTIQFTQINMQTDEVEKDYKEHLPSKVIYE